MTVDGAQETTAGPRAAAPAAATDEDRRSSFETEALPHLDAVRGFALRLAGSEWLAGELVQETFFRALRAWSQYERGTRCKSWLFTICRNTFLHGRQTARRREELLRAAAPAAVPGTPAADHSRFCGTGEADPETRFFRDVIDGEVLRAIDTLPPAYRAAVLLSDLDGLTHEEVAARLEVPVGTVKSRLFRGRRHLRAELAEYAREAGILGGPAPASVRSRSERPKEGRARRGRNAVRGRRPAGTLVAPQPAGVGNGP